ncbi:MAG: LacI family DNA-binding transcriptional regulator [Phototrophicaceae bacterium]
MERVTIRHVAKSAGVGIGTVSRVLNNNPNVSDKTRQLVLDAIDELGFVPNAAARQLPRKAPFQSIGVITRPFFEYYSFAERLRGVQKALEPYIPLYDLSLYSTRSTKNYDERLLSIIQSSVIAGLLIIDFDLTSAQKEALHQQGIPFVGLNHVMNTTDWACIGTSNEDGGYLATQYLTQLGHRRIAYVGNELVDRDGFETSKERYTGYLLALEDADIEHQNQYYRTGELTFESARKLARSLLQLPERPTAIFAMSDVQALGCLEAARELGLRVPDDLSIIGYDDLEMSAHIGLTSVRQHLELGGEIAINYLLQLIHRNEPDTIPQLPDLQIIERRTTAHL